MNRGSRFAVTQLALGISYAIELDAILRGRKALQEQQQALREKPQHDCKEAGCSRDCQEDHL